MLTAGFCLGKRRKERYGTCLILPAQDRSSSLKLWTVPDIIKPRAGSIDQEQSTAGPQGRPGFRWNKGLNDPPKEDIKSPIFEEDTPSVMEIEMEDLDKWMNNIKKNTLNPDECSSGMVRLFQKRKHINKPNLKLHNTCIFLIFFMF
ncbi:transmembrane protein 154 isoform X5 [Lithobates pipiens]